MFIRSMSFCLLLAGAAIQTAKADPVEDFYHGKTISMVVSSSPGGGYDALARVVARYLGKHIPGNPSVIVRNMPGAGGIVATSFIANVAPRDGLTIACVLDQHAFRAAVRHQGSRIRRDETHLARHALGRDRLADRLARLADQDARRRQENGNDRRRRRAQIRNRPFTPGC